MLLFAYKKDIFIYNVVCYAAVKNNVLHVYVYSDVYCLTIQQTGKECVKVITAVRFKIFLACGDHLSEFHFCHIALFCIKPPEMKCELLIEACHLA